MKLSVAWLKSLAPVEWDADEIARRLTLAGVPVADDLIRSCYGSADFKEGVSSFLAKRKPAWRGR